MLNPDVLSRGLAAIDSGVSSLQEFQMISGIDGPTVAKATLEFFAGSGIGSVSQNGISFTASDKIKAAMVCLRNGCDIGGVSRMLSWKDFELLASEVLKAFGYQTRTNVRFVKPRMEIDLVARRSSLVVAVDCKHWSRSNLSLISSYSRMQAARARRLVLEEESKIKTAVPVILTLHAESVKFVERIPIVPVAQLQSFVSDLEMYLPEVCVISRP